MTIRQQLLDGPSDLLAMADDGGGRLAAMGFATVREAFRAALAGRLSARRPQELAFENQILAAACRLLGHPLIDRESIMDFQPATSKRTVGEAIASLNGEPFTVPAAILSGSVRDLLLPLPLHQATEQLEAFTMDDLLRLPMDRLRAAPAIGPKQLGVFIIHLFDFLFLVNEPASGAPTPLGPEEDPGLPARLLLAPWFTMATLQQGRQLLDHGNLRHTLMQQQMAGGVFEEEGHHGQIVIRFSLSTRHPAGFTIDRVSCESCGVMQGHRTLCRHAAALALALLARTGDNPWRLRPLPLLFADTPWQLATDILFDLYGPNPPADLKIVRKGNRWRFTSASKTDFRRVSWQFSDQAMAQCFTLFGGRLPGAPPKNAPPAARQLRALFLNLAKLSAPSKNGGDDDAPHPPGPAPERAASFWGWLAATMAFTLPAPLFCLEGPDKNTLFTLAVLQP
ncbi:MAG: hypothetical protein OEV91_07295, partial [Desulfobulbaceae bacterium]|nr:hypothetical protein [Desulfobulbaceae bacterium]